MSPDRRPTDRLAISRTDTSFSVHSLVANSLWHRTTARRTSCVDARAAVPLRITQHKSMTQHFEDDRSDLPQSRLVVAWNIGADNHREGLPAS